MKDIIGSLPSNKLINQAFAGFLFFFFFNYSNKSNLISDKNIFLTTATILFASVIAGLVGDFLYPIFFGVYRKFLLVSLKITIKYIPINFLKLIPFDFNEKLKLVEEPFYAQSQTYAQLAMNTDIVSQIKLTIPKEESPTLSHWIKTLAAEELLRSFAFSFDKDLRQFESNIQNELDLLKPLLALFVLTAVYLPLKIGFNGITLCYIFTLVFLIWQTEGRIRFITEKLYNSLYLSAISCISQKK